MNNSDSHQSIADSLEVEKILLPYMPYLLQDLWVLGSSVDLILEAIASLSLPRRDVSVLDLGCGKGGVSIQIALRFGFNIVGVDAMPEFLHDAREKANENKVSDLCTFIDEDILSYVSEDHKFDIVILASIGGLFGNNIDTVKKLRSQTKVGGYIIIDDGYLKNKQNISRKGYAHYRNYKKTIEELTMFNDHLIVEIPTSEMNQDINNEYLIMIRRRIIELITKHPELEKELNNYLNLQKEECEVLENEIEGRIWVLRRDSV